MGDMGAAGDWPGQRDRTLILHQLSRRALVLDQLSHQVGNPTPMDIASRFTGGQRIHIYINRPLTETPEWGSPVSSSSGSSPSPGLPKISQCPSN